MKLDFLNTTCAELPRTDNEFGLCDDGRKAYSELINQQTWIATVINNQGLALTFTPVDKCIIQDNQFPGRGRCDGILTSNEHLYFIELKDTNKNWINDSIEQLESTIDLFKTSHNISQYRHKKAFACNRKFKHFQAIDQEQNISFFRKHGVRLDVQAKVIVI